MSKYIILTAIMAISLYGCSKDSKAPQDPVIVLDKISQNTVSAASSDTIVILLNYTMNSDNFSKGPANTKIIFTDSRDSFTIQNYFPFPQELNGYQVDGESKGRISGTITLFLPSDPYLKLRPNRPDGDTAILELYMEDPALKQSEKIRTSPIYIVP